MEAACPPGGAAETTLAGRIGPDELPTARTACVVAWRGMGRWNCAQITQGRVQRRRKARRMIPGLPPSPSRSDKKEETAVATPIQDDMFTSDVIADPYTYQAPGSLPEP